ncbi:uncharacterized mitochondrial protein AtMg00310-like [Tripterygium wilfordii]|uniref:uncharacterized mitochondrial protein AtMg00310-like n=1 Tax=Tripterygium wilfordii TaxID=458696 RepID=UPI0018F824F9|nr:uncharacterized mitochondrial protein AtMg00310-like [Tripterygium wilfordii]
MKKTNTLEEQNQWLTIKDMYAYTNNICLLQHAPMIMVWWGSSEKKNAHCWLSWAKMCTQKKEGGMGFQNFEAFNEALLAKQGWRILKNPESLASKFLKAKYFRNSDFLLAEKNRHSSYLWSSLLDARILLRDGLKWRIGNGMNVHIWQDYWLPKPVSYGAKAVELGFQRNSPVYSLIN